MIPRPPRSTRTDTLFPYTTLFRSTIVMRLNRSSGVGGLAAIRAKNGRILRPLLNWRRGELVEVALENDLPFVDDPSNSDDRRSEERRVGKECVSTCRSRWSPYH